ncbi:hypothetical protein [Nocardioides coralli]|uniref:hypothetical protein n=1 Tax=Nocardioides coralli TaxID=2872154 RepID=UPI001CA42813|nr:hypothetical protein [Nocardioides coralli]QZY29749.1 hypothetical protein K6T13_03380 [Nocardioides coralli]
MTHPPAAPPDLPLEVRTGDTPARVTVALLRARGWVLALLVGTTLAGALVSAGVAAIPQALALSGAMLALIAGVVVVAVWITSGYSLTVTHTELVLRRVRTRTLARADLGELVIGFCTVQATDPAAIQLCITTRQGRRFATLGLIHWPPDELHRVASALGIEPRDQTPDDTRLSPLWIRRPFLFIGGWTVGAFALVIVTIAVVMAVAG